MQVTVKFFSFFRPIAGTDQLSIDLPDGATLARLMTCLTERFNAPIFSSNEGTIMMVNRKNAFPDTVLKEGDDVLLLPVLGGG